MQTTTKVINEMESSDSSIEFEFSPLKMCYVQTNTTKETDVDAEDLSFSFDDDIPTHKTAPPPMESESSSDSIEFVFDELLPTLQHAVIASQNSESTDSEHN
ncbi:hypothetical protein QTN25_009340 [Entamoeba marina]